MAQFGDDPVSAITEEEAAGQIAEIFADIRDTMGIPLLTSIWRTLVSVDGGLEAVWAAAKPLYLSGFPQLALASIATSDDLPVPKPLLAGQLESAGLTSEDITSVRAIVSAYNRSNGMNMLALSCLLAKPHGDPLPKPKIENVIHWPPIPRLLPQNEIEPDVWRLLLEINKFGAVEDGALAPLWRHLARWPGFLSILHDVFVPLQRSGDLSKSVQRVHEVSGELAARMAYLKTETVALPVGAHEMVESYVAIPGAVTRMVTLGHAVANWLDSVVE